VTQSMSQTGQSDERNWYFASEGEILRGYQEMAADEEREKDAVAWIEAFVGECL